MKDLPDEKKKELGEKSSGVRVESGPSSEEVSNVLRAGLGGKRLPVSGENVVGTPSERVRNVPAPSTPRAPGSLGPFHVKGAKAKASNRGKV